MSQNALQREFSLRFGAGQSQELDTLLRQLEQSGIKEHEEFLDKFVDPSSPVWLRYSQAIYNNPKTWWIGLIQISMLSGLWGHKYRRVASIRQSILSQTFRQYFSRRSEQERIKDAEQIIRYNLTYRKADLLGRLHGGLFQAMPPQGARLATGYPTVLKYPQLPSILQSRALALVFKLSQRDIDRTVR